MSLTSEQRRLRAEIAAHGLWAKCDDRTAQTALARDAFDRRFVDDVDPNRTLAPEERARRVEHARKAYFKRLALASSRARAARADARATAKGGGGRDGS